MSQNQYSNYIITELQQLGKPYGIQDKHTQVAYQYGVLVGILAGLCEQDSKNYQMVKNRLKELGAPTKN